MTQLLALARFIDTVNERIGRAAAWLIVAAVIISAGNAIIRKTFDTSSNAWLELQWWLFGMVFLLAAPWTLKANEHIRIDVLSGYWSKRARDWIDVAGHALFLLPVAIVTLWTAVPFFVTSYLQNEQSSNAGGLPQWPAKLLIPLGFALLLLQGFSELVKRIAILRGEMPDPASAGPPHAHDATGVER